MDKRTNAPGASLLDYIKGAPQILLPGHLLSGLMHRFTRIEAAFLRIPFTRWFARKFKIDMEEAVNTDPANFRDFNSFFTRALKSDARPICEGENTIASPVDGHVSQGGGINDGSIFQAKGRAFSLFELLGGSDTLTEEFEGGDFLNIYLSPQDYHRIHMPITGTLREMHYVPGRLFSVSPATVRAIPQLFARNERVISIFDTEAGPMAMIKVGAIFVSSTETVWHGEIGPRGPQPWSKSYEGKEAVTLNKGDEMGRFNMGSTVILLFANGKTKWLPDFTNHQHPTRMGEQIGHRVEARS
ncbi:phosphatidylserine decarboxylase [Solemya pervernicosa gill symbiont]|uniref:Phosphatidylserine decarboxylase proenzyme n=2 Tax=Gammaproteobacteria incertae sedis TaxID=118884 RepID=A0A1T2L6T5_9GAMM|nr:archaetidylserine decarboxylase [Candidatus Reidiella endopervernicosa]OOZ40801.1 phosphatidylserine decarboxylase [Solemya pervernicosa gill symbiont]QKQ28214.1 phosphatidylserine decarboxylase [Candidatus Reidiella endopervernicosa]